MSSKRLFFDMDGTLTKFHDNIMDEYGQVQIEKMYTHTYFTDLLPFENMVETIKRLKENYPDVEIFVLSSVDINSQFNFIDQKNRWLDQYLSIIDRNHRIYPEMGTNKTHSIPFELTNNDYLIDDYNVNLKEFIEAGGSAIKCKNNINHKGLGAYGGDKGELWSGHMISTESGPNIIMKDILSIMEQTSVYEQELSAEQNQNIINCQTLDDIILKSKKASVICKSKCNNDLIKYKKQSNHNKTDR